jgi:hypothetical protein
MKTSLKNKLAAASMLALSAVGTAHAAAPAQPDVTDVVAYIIGAVATIALIGNASLIVRVTTRVYGWVRAAIR